MAIRNWWIDVDIDGRQTRLSGGPRNKDGGFSLRIYQRDDNSIIEAGYIRGRVGYDDKLILEGSINGQIIKMETKR